MLDARNRAELRRVAAIADPDLVPIVLTYDDIAYKTGTIFSPKWLRRLGPAPQGADRRLACARHALPLPLRREPFPGAR